MQISIYIVIFSSNYPAIIVNYCFDVPFIG